MDRLHEHYVASSGLDEGAVEETREGWRIRFERQLTRPIPGQGARLILTQTGPAGMPDARVVAYDAWKARINELAGHIYSDQKVVF